MIDFCVLVSGIAGSTIANLLSKKYSLFYFILSIISGILQSLAIFSFYPFFVTLNLIEIDQFGNTFMNIYQKYYLNFFNELIFQKLNLFDY